LLGGITLKIFTYLIIIIIALVGITFASLNAEPVAVNYYIGQKMVPLSLLLTFVLIAGSFLGLGVGFLKVFKLKYENKRLNQKLKLIEREVSNLRSIPLKDNRPL